MESVMNRCARVCLRARAVLYGIYAVFYADVAEVEPLTDECIEEAVELCDAGEAVLEAMIDATDQAHEGGTVPEEMPLPFESLEAMDDDALRDWLIAKIEAKAGKEFFYE